MQRIALLAAFSMFATGCAFAADLPQAAPPPPRAPVAYLPAPPVYNWGGIYYGVNAGGAWVSQSATTMTNLAGAVEPTTSISSTGFAGGGQLGANFQANELVFGIEADADYLSNKTTNLGTTTLAGAVVGTSQFAYKLDFLSTVRGRVGYAADRTLFYATGGLAMGEYSVTRTQTTGRVGVAGAGTAETYNDLRLGWTAGLGLEYAFADNWNARIEYLYASLEKVSYTFPLAGRNVTTPTESVNMVRAGLNYKFNF
jgi:outer membrane immunogenic protein